MTDLRNASDYGRCTAPRKPRQCPACGKAPVAGVLYGLPAYSLQLQEKLDKGLVVFGGCLVEEGAPDWHCTACGVSIHKERAQEKVARGRL